jgi:hypothetical protein
MAKIFLMRYLSEFLANKLTETAFRATVKALMKLAAACLILLCSQAFAHGDHHHPGKGALTQAPSTPEAVSVNQKINEAYVQRVRPIFVEKCFDCHSSQPRFPSYYKIPGVKQFIDSDIADGKKHLDFSKDYPFVSHATPVEDLDAIRKEIDEGDMPPFTYRLMHRDAAITPDEKKLIYDWVDWSKSQLQQKFK